MTQLRFLVTLVATLMFLLVVGGSLEVCAQTSTIRSVDFRNFNYHPSCVDPEDSPKGIRTTDGVYSKGDASDPSSDRVYFEVTGVVYGDLNGDGQEEAVVTTNCNTGGSGQFSDGTIFTMRSGKVEELGTLGAGDRADGGIHSVRIVNRLLKVERYGQEHSGACCPEYIETTTLRLTGKGLVQVGKSTRRPYKEDEEERGSGPAARPVHFERGRSSAEIKDSTSSDQSYTLRAKAGQTMIVNLSAAKKNATVSVLGEDESPIEGKADRTGWTGVLPYSGQYRIVVHATEGTATYTLEVTIR